jgi:hypothetical protein
MWSDVVLRAEELHLLRLMGWGALSTVVGIGLFVAALFAGLQSTLLRRFAITCAVAGALELLVAVLRLRSLGLRDLSAAARLERLSWLELGLFIGLSMVGATLVLTAGRGESTTERPTGPAGAIGAGIAILIHGATLVVLQLLLLPRISR